MFPNVFSENREKYMFGYDTFYFFIKLFLGHFVLHSKRKTTLTILFSFFLPF